MGSSDRSKAQARMWDARVSRRTLLAGSAATGGAVLALSGPAALRPAHAADDYITQEASPQSMALGPGRFEVVHRDVYNTFDISAAAGVMVVEHAGRRYLVVVTNARRNNVLQVFDADDPDATAPVIVGEVPTLGSGNVAYDGAGTVYFSSRNVLMKVDLAARQVHTLGQVTDGVTSYLNLIVDRTGHLWASTYPLGGLVRLDGEGNEVARTPSVGLEPNQYARGLDITPDGRTLFFGSGTNDPALFSVPVDDPSAVTRIPLPDTGDDYTVSSLAVRGDKVFVWYFEDEATAVLRVYDHTRRTWADTEHRPAGRSLTQVQPDGYVYFSARQKVQRFRPVGDLVFEEVAELPEGYLYPVHSGAAGGFFYAVRLGDDGMQAHRVDLAGRGATEVVYPVIESPAPPHSMSIHPGVHTAYFGGYRGGKLTAANLDTGVVSESPSTGINVAQVEGSMPFERYVYVGSYGKALITRMDTTVDVTSPDAFLNLGNAGEGEHPQDRPFAWTTTRDRVVFGTVPRPGHDVGGLGTITDPGGRRPKIQMAFEPFVGLSVIGLAGAGDLVYGATSVLTGLGVTQQRAAADIFAFDVATQRLVWRRTLEGEVSLYGPVLMEGLLYYATSDTVYEVDRAGAVLRSIPISTREKVVNGREVPGWRDVQIKQVPGTRLLAHMIGGLLILVDPDTTQRGVVNRALAFQGEASDPSNRLGRMDFDRDGRLWVTKGGDVARVDVAPLGPGDHFRSAYAQAGGVAAFGHSVAAEKPIPTVDGRGVGFTQDFARRGVRTRFFWSAASGRVTWIANDSAVWRQWNREGGVAGIGLPSTNLRTFDGGSWQEFTAVGTGERVRVVVTGGEVAVLPASTPLPGRLPERVR